MKEFEDQLDKPALLTTASNTAEANIIEALLKTYNIPVAQKNKGAGVFLEIYGGFTRFAVEIYVPQKSLEQAQEILENNRSAIEEESELTENPEYIEELQESDEAEKIEETPSQKRRRTFGLILLIIALLPFVIRAIGLIVYFISMAIENLTR